MATGTIRPRTRSGASQRGPAARNGGSARYNNPTTRIAMIAGQWGSGGSDSEESGLLMGFNLVAGRGVTTFTVLGAQVRQRKGAQICLPIASVELRQSKTCRVAAGHFLPLIALRAPPPQGSKNGARCMRRAEPRAIENPRVRRET